MVLWQTSISPRQYTSRRVCLGEAPLNTPLYWNICISIGGFSISDFGKGFCTTRVRTAYVLSSPPIIVRVFKSTKAQNYICIE